MPIDTKSQPVRVKSPFADDLIFSRMEGFEELGRLFRYQLELLSPKEDLNLDDLLGKDLTVELDLPSGQTRYFHGYVTEFSQTGRHGDYATYSAVVHPWFWFLTRNSDCRIFQGKTVPDIIQEVFRDHGFTNFKDELKATYRTWEYCVQYRETDFNFISRLMEQEGIYYYFEHEEDKHTLILSDAYGAHSPMIGYDRIPYFPPSQSVDDEHISDWFLSKSVRSGTCVVGAYHFINPGADLNVTSSILHPHDNEAFEIFDYPGEHFDRGEGDRYANIRMEEIACDYERVRGETDARGVYPGGLFELTDHPRKDQNREYLVISARYKIVAGDYASGGGGGFQFGCSFEAMGSQDVFRSFRSTPKPVVQGPQTAVVVGKKGEEIWTDEHGRIKVHFHWDRHDKRDETSSCWIRVSQAWAGGSWGGMTIPRMGQEVIVDFIEGDPDRPIVTGRVYNGANKPPYELPSEKTISTLKSRSTKGGGGDNFNEIRFEDKKGEEQLFMQAEKNFDLRVKNDRFETIGQNRHMVVDKDKFEHIKNDRNETVDNHHNEKIGGDMNITVEGKEAKAVKNTLSLTVHGDVAEVFKKNHSMVITDDCFIKGTNIVIEGTTNITLKVGKSYIAIEASGIEIGTTGNVDIDAKQNVDIKGGIGVKIEGGVSVDVKGVTTKVEGSAMAELKGGIVKIN